MVDSFCLLISDTVSVKRGTDLRGWPGGAGREQRLEMAIDHF